MTIYEIAESYMSLIEAGLDDGYDQEIIEEMKKDIEEDLESKADDYMKVDKELEATESALDAEIKRLTARKKTISENRKHIKETLQMVMEATGKTKFKTELFSFNIQNNPPSVVMDMGIEELPLEYLVPQDPTINKKLIMEQLKAGQELEFAHLEQGRSLRVR